MDLVTTKVYSYGGWPLDYGFPLKGDILNFQGEKTSQRGTVPLRGERLTPMLMRGYEGPLVSEYEGPGMRGPCMGGTMLGTVWQLNGAYCV